MVEIDFSASTGDGAGTEPLSAGDPLTAEPTMSAATLDAINRKLNLLLSAQGISYTEVENETD